MSEALRLLGRVPTLALALRPGWHEAIMADVWTGLDAERNRSRRDAPIIHHMIAAAKVAPQARPNASDSDGAATLRVDAPRFVHGSLHRATARRVFEPIPLTYAELQGRLCAEEAFHRATAHLNSRDGHATYDEYLDVYGDVVELLMLMSNIAPELRLFTIAERVAWLCEAIGTVIDKTRCLFLGSIRHIENRGEFAPGMHANIGLVRDFLISPETRSACSFDAIVAA